MISAPGTQSSGTRPDWRGVADLWAQTCMLEDADNRLPTELTDALAQALGDVFASYHDAEADYVDDLVRVVAQVERRALPADPFLLLYCGVPRADPRTGGRRVPPPFEAAVETARRLRDLRCIQNHLAIDSDLCAGILGGSTSYGGFYSTIGGVSDACASDLDLLLVLAPEARKSDIYERLAAVRGLSGAAEAIERSYESSPAVVDAMGGCDAPIFSHKLAMWKKSRDPLIDGYELSGSYRVSTHLLSLEQFRFVILDDLSTITDDLDRRIWQLRDTQPKRRNRERTFSGRERVADRQLRATSGGWLAESRVAHVADRRFRPGLFQNLILPAYDLRWDMRRQPLGHSLAMFRRKIVQRLLHEQRLRPSEIQRVSLSHTRSPYFATHVRVGVDAI